MKNNLSVITELQPIARRMRERQESIERDKGDVYGRIANLIATAQEQGKDCLTAKAKLGGSIKWADWLSAHVPTLGEKDAAKYERLTCEQLRDPRQCLFAFLPAPEQQPPTDQRTPPSPREMLWGRIAKVRDTFKSIAIETWTQEDADMTRQELEPVARALWPERFA